MLSALVRRRQGPRPKRQRPTNATNAVADERTNRARRHFRKKLPAWLLEIVEQEERELPTLAELDSLSLDVGAGSAGPCPFFHKATYGEPVVPRLRICTPD